MSAHWQWWHAEVDEVLADGCGAEAPLGGDVCELHVTRDGITWHSTRWSMDRGRSRWRV